MNIDFALSDEDVERIAAAIVAKMGSLAKAAKPAGKAADKPADKTTTTTTKPAEPDTAAADAAKSAEELAKFRKTVLDKVRAVGDAKGKDVAKGAIQKFAATFGEVADDDLQNLLDALNELDKAEEEGDY